jgi:hypothetical protein
MADIKERIAREVDEMVAIGQKLSRDAAASGSHLGPDRVEELSSMASRAGQLIRRLYGPSSQYQENLDRLLKTKDFASMHSNWCRHVAELVGIIKGIQTDIRTGLIEDFRALVQAEVFSDFLEMAEHLLETNYKDPAAVLLGAVLEDTLRKLAVKSGIPVIAPNGKPLTLDPLNVALAKAGNYGPLIQKQVTSWANLRNDAAHGHFEKYDPEQVKHMLLFVQKFCSEHLT